MNQEPAPSFHVDVRPRDPLIARDGRPFAAGLRMRALDSIYPSVFAGSLRTLLGQLAGGFPPRDSDAYATLTTRLKKISIAGPLLSIRRESREELVFPAPLDAVARRLGDNTLVLHGIRPVEWDVGVGCDFLPERGMFPVTYSSETDPEFKPEAMPPLWSESVMSAWLTNESSAFLAPGSTEWPTGFHRAAAKDVRFHAEIAHASGVAAEGKLFMTTALDLTHLSPASGHGGWHDSPGVAIVARATTIEPEAALAQLATWSPLGGERRIAFWSSRHSPDGDPLWTAPSIVESGLRNAQFVRLVLATPALFANGWRPSWLQSAGIGQPYTGRVNDVELRLVGAALGRWKPISGWSYESRPAGPKPVRRMVPAGSVYFFRVEFGDPATLAKHWLLPVSDDLQDRRDGFGLGLWGPWKPFREEHTFDVRR